MRATTHNPAVYQARMEELDQLIAEHCAWVGCALHPLFGTSTTQTVEVEQVDGTFEAVTLDFTSPERALATAEDTRLPVDIATWLMVLPVAAREYRDELIRSKSSSSFGKQS